MKFFLASLLSLICISTNAQICTSLHRGMDRQIVMPDNHLIVMNTLFLGDLMDMYYDDKEITIEYAIFSPKGDLITDTTLLLKWNDMHYDYSECVCTYNPNYNIDKIYNEVNSDKEACPIYFPYFNGNDLVVSYFLRGDRRNLYEISIHNNGESNWFNYNIDTLSALQGTPNSSAIKTEMNKSLFFKTFLDNKYTQLKVPPRTPLIFDSISNSHSIKDKDLRFTPLSKETFTKYKLTGKNWEIVLNGTIVSSYSHPSKQPLIDLKGDVLFVTVFNDDYESCPGYGRDTYPLVYAIDVKKGKVLWQKMLF